MTDLSVSFFFDINIMNDIAVDKKCLINLILRFLLMYLQRILNSVNNIKYKMLNNNALSFFKFMI